MMNERERERASERERERERCMVLNQNRKQVLDGLHANACTVTEAHITSS